ncbi:hypothetical protein QBC43DRAFT_309597 [Cladorrhinum sp. PSN259]|nr:hypothetical protein QBC43DRAFT_309597 [Cladorrhinum sp. PSN259]
MLLLELHSEILLEIFDHVGSSYFRSDSSRLTVCRRWSQLALAQRSRDLRVTPKTLRRLVSSPSAESSLRQVKDSVETLVVDLEQMKHWRSYSTYSQYDSRAGAAPSIRTMLDIQGYDARMQALRQLTDFMQKLHSRANPVEELNEDLVRLAASINGARKMRALQIQATMLLPNDYLDTTTIRPFLSATNLNSLELDLCGTKLEPPPRERAGACQVCTNIAALLTTLRRLRLRMRTICANVLKPQQHSTSLRLNEILINLSTSDGSHPDLPAAHAVGCGSSKDKFPQLKAEMESQAQVLVTQMAAPKMVRILTHTDPDIQMQAFDGLTGRRIKLSKGAEWDDDGEYSEEKVADQ